MESEECRCVWDFFHRSSSGIFVEVGANHPKHFSQTWFLEQQGWSGILIEPNPELCELLRAERPRSCTVQSAVGNPPHPCNINLYVASRHFGVRSSVIPNRKHSRSKPISVPLRSLDSILGDVGIRQADFVSIDVEGYELEVLQGFDLSRYRPKLILIEDHRHDFKKHFYLRRHEYRLVKRTGLNNWYVPSESKATVLQMNSSQEILKMWRKMWLNAPFDIAYRYARNIFSQAHR